MSQMPDSFLAALIDSSGSSFHFGKETSTHHSAFLFASESHVASKKGSTEKFIQLYHGHGLNPINREPLLRKNVSPDWFFPIILIVLIVFAWLRIFYGKFFSQMIKAFLNNNLANQIVRDENIFVQRASVYLSVVFNLIGALLLYLISIHYDWSLGGIGNGFSRFIFFAVIVTVAYTLKFLVLKICGWLFEQEREMATYMFNIFLINNILGMALLPLICIIAYNETSAVSWLLPLSFILICIALAWRIFRGIQIGLSIASFSPLYLFLYLCTLEIAPLMVLIRIIVQ